MPHPGASCPEYVVPKYKIQQDEVLLGRTRPQILSTGNWNGTVAWPPTAADSSVRWGWQLALRTSCQWARGGYEAESQQLAGPIIERKVGWRFPALSSPVISFASKNCTSRSTDCGHSFCSGSNWSCLPNSTAISGSHPHRQKYVVTLAVMLAAHAFGPDWIYIEQVCTINTLLN